jgi:hypothetical protein
MAFLCMHPKPLQHLHGTSPPPPPTSTKPWGGGGGAYVPLKFWGLSNYGHCMLRSFPFFRLVIWK